MPRNATGTYSLPAGNPVVTGTTISITWANNTLNDLAAEITDSLSRSGEGGMMAPLQATDGSAAAPSVTFGNDTDCGLYRVGANDVGLSVAGGQIAHFTSTAIQIASTVSFTQSTTNAAAITATGNGTGDGVVTTGGSSDGDGITATGGATNGNGVVAQGAGSGAGVNATGGTSAAVGVVGTGGPAGLGGQFANGTAATADTGRNAVALTNGYLTMAGVTNPNNDIGYTNVLTPLNIVKAWARIQTDGAGNATILDGFNISGATLATTVATITIVDDLADSNYAAFGTFNTSGEDRFVKCYSNGVGSFRAEVYDVSAAADVNLATTITNFSVMILGMQGS